MRKAALLILDGAGWRESSTGNAVTAEHLPRLFAQVRSAGVAVLEASGEAVGLEAGQVGNSEAGHLTIGAGRMVPSLARTLFEAYQNGSWAADGAWSRIATQGVLHIVGLLSDAGVHALARTMHHALLLADQCGVPNIYVHPVLDGVDSVAGSALELMNELESELSRHPRAHLGVVQGRRFFADRSGNLDVSRAAEQALTGVATLSPYSPEALSQHLRAGSSEAHFPAHCGRGGRAIAAGEPILLTSHRADRARQIATLLAEKHPLYAITDLGKGVPVSHVFFPQRALTTGLAYELKQANIPSARIAEKCKFPHVTFFLNGLDAGAEGRGICVDSIPEQEIPKHPEMSAHEVTQEILKVLRNPQSRALIANLANLDQVGHLGNLTLATRAANIVDEAIGTIAQVAKENGWSLLITSDHGNADCMTDEEGRPFGSHTQSPVPLVCQAAPALRARWISNRGTLANVAASYLAALGLPRPAFMQPSLLEFEPLVS